MFAGGGQLAAFQPLGRSDRKPMPPLVQNPVQFPTCTPQTTKKSQSSPRGTVPLAKLLQAIYRPTDIRPEHFEAIGVHVISDASPRNIIPDPAFLPPAEEWLAVCPDELEGKNEATKKTLNNGKLSPGIKTYVERRQELSVDNAGAFRTVLRLPTPAGETAIRLGNAYAFFKHLEQISTYWHDTSVPKPEEHPTDPPLYDPTPQARQMNERIGAGSPLHTDFRQQLITAFIKLVAYDFGCNVAFARCEPRLHLKPTPPSSPSYFNSSASFIHRTPTDPASTRSGVIEGPVAAISSRASTIFSTAADSNLDFGRELVAILLTAQQRAREGHIEKRFGADEWWTTKPRWGGGPGGAIGREADTPEEVPTPPATAATPSADRTTTMNDIKRAIGGINGPVIGKRSRRSAASHLYENYRKMLPPSSGWDRRARYSAIGKARGSGADDIFLVSALNHHVSIVRARVPDSLLDALEGKDAEWDSVVVWRSRWFDLFLKEDRIQGMDLIWGMMAWLMRSDDAAPEDGDGGDDQMDLTS